MQRSKRKRMARTTKTPMMMTTMIASARKSIQTIRTICIRPRGASTIRWCWPHTVHTPPRMTMWSWRCPPPHDMATRSCLRWTTWSAALWTMLWWWSTLGQARIRIRTRTHTHTMHMARTRQAPLDRRLLHRRAFILSMLRAGLGQAESSSCQL